MPSTYGIKELHEQATCVRFLQAYNAAHDASVDFIKLQDPPSPDCLCSEGLEIELVSVYYSQDEARQRFLLARGKMDPPVVSRILVNPDKIIFEQIDVAVRTKAGKQYTVDGNRLWLVIRIDAPLLEWQDLVDGYLGQARGLPTGPFEQIWVVLSDDEGDHVSQLAL